MTMICNINPHILKYIEAVESGEIVACEDQIKLVAYIRQCFAEQDIYTDNDLLEKYLGLAKYFPFDQLFPWEEFCTALHLCTFWSASKKPRWPDLFLLIGRGAGKDGYIAYESMCLTSPYSGLHQYDVDICANAEEQAMRPVNDLLGIFDNTLYSKKLQKHYYWTKEKIVGLKYGGTIKGRTNNPKSKDGMRSGIVIFNEIHQYQNYSNIKVFVTGQGKTKHPRRLYATTNGDVRDGPLDELLALSLQILDGVVDDNGMLPFICRLNCKEDAKDKSKWPMANPSLPYLPDLMDTIEKEFTDWQTSPASNPDFMTKRMNLPQSDAEIQITEWENIKASNKDIPDLTGLTCTCGIDFVKVTDFASVNLHFKKDDLRFDINHSWLCLKSADLQRIKAPWQQWAEAGHLTLVDDVEINPELLADWILDKASQYSILKIGLDNFRYALIAKSLKRIGFDAKENKNVKLIRPSDIMKIVPVIDSCFVNQYFIWGDNPPLRWAANNTKLVRAGRTTGTDTGNFYYGKIEARSRKTDPFMALVASMILEDELPETADVADIPVITI